MGFDWQSPFDTGRSLSVPGGRDGPVGRTRKAVNKIVFAILHLSLRILLIGLLGLVFLFLLILWGDGAFTPYPSLLAKESSNFTRASEPEFQSRLESWYPPGSSESELVAALVRHRFETNPGRRAALYRISSIICVDEANVAWDADEAGHLTGIRGWFDSVCL